MWFQCLHMKLHDFIYLCISNVLLPFSAMITLSKCTLLANFKDTIEYCQLKWPCCTLESQKCIHTVNHHIQFSSITQAWPTLCDPMDFSTSDLPVYHQLPEFTQTPIHRVGDTIQLSHPLLSPSSAFNLSQHQGLFKWVSSSHQVAKVLELQLQHESFQWIFRVDFL